MFISMFHDKKKEDNEKFDRLLDKNKAIETEIYHLFPFLNPYSDKSIKLILLILFFLCD